MAFAMHPAPRHSVIRDAAVFSSVVAEAWLIAQMSSVPVGAAVDDSLGGVGAYTTCVVLPGGDVASCSMQD